LEKVHPLLLRQIKKYFGDIHSLPGFAEGLMEAVNRAYRQFDEDRQMLERSLEISSKELIQSNSDMRTLFERIINSSVDGILAFDGDYRYTVWNPGMERITCVKKENALGRPISAVFPAFEETKENRFFSETLSGKTVIARERPYSVPETGRKGYFEGHFSPLRNDAGEPIGGLGIIRDITDRKRAEEALRESEEQNRLLIESMAEAVYGLDPGGNFTFCNPACLRFLGYKESGDLIGKNVHDLIHHTKSDGTRYPENECRINQAIRSGDGIHVDDEVHWRADGSFFPVEYWSYPVHRDGILIGAVVTFMDISERKQASEALRQSEERLRIAINASQMYTWEWDIQSDRIQRSGRVEEVYGSEVPGWDSCFASFLETIHPEDRKKVQQAVEDACQGTAPYRIDFRVVRSTGEVRWLEAQGQVLRDGAARTVRMMGVTQDITERKQAEKLIQQMAFYDTLTELPNRNTLYDRLLNAIKADDGRGKPMALLLMDVDHFKEINDTLGHQRGDLLLKELGVRLKRVLFEPDIVARLGGDEFAILLPALARVEDISIVIQKIQDVLQPSFMIEGLPIAVEASIGVVLYPDHGKNTDNLLQRADVAMYTAKQTGSPYIIYDPKYDGRTPRRLALIGELRQAIEKDQLFLDYQPKISLKTGQVMGVEALVRWKHPEYGIIPPDQFILPAEQTGLIHPLTRWVFDSALRQMQTWCREGLNIPVSINLSARNLHDPGLAERLETLLKASGERPEQLELEITESAIMTDPQRALEGILRLRGIGVRFSLDDFGVGYSSLAYLKKLPVDTIKIDKSFVIDLAKDEDDGVIVLSTINLAHNLGLKVVAEGVESQKIWDRLAAFGCDAAQGFFMCRPVPASELSRWMAQSPGGG